jgi:hypothetical protein
MVLPAATPVNQSRKALAGFNQKNRFRVVLVEATKELF